MTVVTHTDPEPDVRKSSVRVIAVTGGKGGVGKTCVSVNLAMAMAGLGRKVMLLDADLGLANVDVLLGLHPQRNLSHVLSGECGIADIIVEAPGGLRIIPAASGISRMANLNPAEHVGLIRAFSELTYGLDALIVDTAAGMSDLVVSFTRACQEVAVVVCDEPASLANACALLKVLNGEHGQNRFHMLANMVRDQDEGRALYQKFSRYTDRFMSVALDYLGAVPFDDHLRRAVQKQRAVVDAYPASKASAAFRKIAQSVDGWPVDDTAGGHVQFFFERLVRAQPARVSALI